MLRLATGDCPQERPKVANEVTLDRQLNLLWIQLGKKFLFNISNVTIGEIRIPLLIYENIWVSKSSQRFLIGVSWEGRRLRSDVYFPIPAVLLGTPLCSAPQGASLQKVSRALGGWSVLGLWEAEGKLRVGRLYFPLDLVVFFLSIMHDQL